ncbi:glycosyltransferase [Belnapia moabensis]|uniref:glycosyltransferase n=1 Tax=Belnapia moabensis TaxID=365533 RepID=UPI000693BAF6|nr:glycosyltransferase [Belnapia moabensis]
MPKSHPLKPRVLRDLAEIDGADGWWEATGPAAAFRLEPGPTGLPRGWLRITMLVQAPRKALVAPAFKADTGGGYQPLRVVLPRSSAGSRWSLMIHLPPGTIALAMTPPVAQGPFRLDRIEAQPTTRPLVGARLALSLGQRWVQEPQHFAHTARNLVLGWRGMGRAGLRQALGQTLLGDGPVTAPPVVSGKNRYEQWIAEQEGLIPLPVALRLRRISVLLPVPPDTTATALAATLDSLRVQSSTDWDCRLGLAPGAAPPAGLDPALAQRLAVLPLGSAERGAMLAALAAGATGEGILVLDPGDILAPDALAALAASEAELSHGDEDRIGPDGRRAAPLLKPEWSPDLLEAFNYFGRPVALDRAAVDAAGGFTPGTGAGAEWDLHLRLAATGSSVARIPRILCHRPAAVSGDRLPPGSAGAAELRAILAAHWQRQGIAAEVETRPDGTQRATWPIAEPPLVSIVIPNRDRPGLLAQCLRGLMEETDYPRIEIVIVDSGSSDPETLALYARLKAEGRIRLITFREPFNYSAACNAGARAATGELLLFLNNDIAVTRPDWLAELVRHALRPGVGVVGTMLVYPDNRLQHAGVTIGMHLCGLLFRLAPETEWGPIGSPSVPRTVSAIMGACQMVRREAFAQAGGFDESFVMANSDVALCLAARALGWRTAYTPFARLIHHEGASRGHSNPVADLTRTVIDLRRFGYHEDPFFHPALDADSNIPRLRIGTELGNAASLTLLSRRHGAGLAAPVPLDLSNDAEVVEAVSLPADVLFWPPARAEVIGDTWSAVRWIIDLLRRRPDLRARFPDALSAGAGGAFARWLAGDGAAALCLPDRTLPHLTAAFAADPAARARQAVLSQGGLPEELPLAFLPPGRAGLLGLLFRRDGAPLRREEIWWLALLCAEDPARELLLSHRFNPGWQALFPDGPTAFGSGRMAAWLRATFRCEGDWTDPAHWPTTQTPAEQLRLGWYSRPHWQHAHPAPFADAGAARALLGWLAGPEAALDEAARAWLAAQPPEALAEALARPGLAVIGHLCYPSGLRTSTLSITEGLREVGYDLTMRDVPVDAEHDLPQHAAFGGFELHEATLLHIQPEPYFHEAYARAGLRSRSPRTHRIGYWYWELDSVPTAWASAVAETDELWTATRFVGDALRSRFDVPVFEFMPGVTLPPFTRRTPEHFGIPPGRFTFLFAFHMMSIMERKNPLGLIRAFRAAFTEADAATLVLKTSFGEKHPALIAELHAAAAEAGGRIIVIDRVFTSDETVSLMDACDCYVSLHRTEGLGLTMAEAMLLAKPVIGTRYSGNLDFMTEENSLLVDYRLVEIAKPVPPYDAGTRWAEPSEAHAAQLMRQVYENRNFARTLGARAQAELKLSLSTEAAGHRMAARLRTIRNAQQGEATRSSSISTR